MIHLRSLSSPLRLRVRLSCQFAIPFFAFLLTCEAPWRRLSTVVMAILMRNGLFPPLAAAIGVLIAILCGTSIGAASILFQAPSFIISLAAIGVFQGIALFITQGTIQTIYGQFETLGGAKIFNFIPLLFVIALAG